MARSNVPGIVYVSKTVKDSTPCKDCNDRDVGCHGKCEKYKAFQERLREDRKKRVEAYAPEQMHENYSRNLHQKIQRRQRTEGR